MTSPIIFLDMDGVLVTRESIKAGKKLGTSAKLHQPCVSALNWLTDQTGAKIVVSSTWRFSGLEFMQQRLRESGVTGEVIDTTPKMLREVGKLVIAARRGHEIGDWLLRHPEVKSFVILDDDDDMAGLKGHLVQSTMEDGLTMELAKRALTVLGRH